jgi:hypothetical protein
VGIPSYQSSWRSKSASRDLCSAANASKEPWLIKEELKRVKDVLTWAQKHESLISYTKLIEKASEGIGFTSFEEGDDGVRRRTTPAVIAG